MSLEIFADVLSRTMSAPVFHSDQRNLHLFLSFNGFAALHEYQFFDESRTFQDVKKFVIELYGRLPSDESPEQFNLWSDLVGEKTRFDLTADQKWEVVKESWKRYGDWEEESWKRYQAAAEKLRHDGKTTAARFVESLADGVFGELSRVNDLYLMYKGMDWDLPTLTSLQPEIQEHWEKELRGLFKKAS